MSPMKDYTKQTLQIYPTHWNELIQSHQVHSYQCHLHCLFRPFQWTNWVILDQNKCINPTMQVCTKSAFFYLHSVFCSNITITARKASECHCSFIYITLSIDNKLIFFYLFYILPLFFFFNHMFQKYVTCPSFSGIVFLLCCYFMIFTVYRIIVLKD